MTKSIKATIMDIIVALLITLIILGGIKLFLGQEIDDAIFLVNKVAVQPERTGEEEVATMNTEKKRLETYPEYRTQYATIEIPKIDANLPVYYGDKMDILKKGVGHSAGSYFPGEGGSIVYMGHNSKSVFRRLGELEIGDTIKVTTDYGVYNYKVYDTQLIKETEKDKIPIQDEIEILMIYTCYPFNNIGHATQRYVVYAELVEE